MELSPPTLPISPLVVGVAGAFGPNVCARERRLILSPSRVTFEPRYAQRDPGQWARCWRLVGRAIGRGLHHCLSFPQGPGDQSAGDLRRCNKSTIAKANDLNDLRPPRIAQRPEILALT
jgi:hypothetical protein